MSNQEEKPIFCICQLPWSKDHIVRGALIQLFLHVYIKSGIINSAARYIDDVIVDTPKYKYTYRQGTGLYRFRPLYSLYTAR